EVSPLTVGKFFSDWGARVIISELKWVWLPSAVAFTIGQVIRRYRYGGATRRSTRNVATIAARSKAKPSPDNIAGLCHFSSSQPPDTVVRPVPCCMPYPHHWADIRLVPKSSSRKVVEA